MCEGFLLLHCLFTVSPTVATTVQYTDNPRTIWNENFILIFYLLRLTIILKKINLFVKLYKSVLYPVRLHVL